MKSAVFLPLAAIGACAATAAPPVPSLSPTRTEKENVSQVEAIKVSARDGIEEQVTPAGDGPALVTKTVLEGSQRQGGLLRGQTPVGNRVYLDGTEVLVDEYGHFIIGFDRDHPDKAELKVVSPDGTEEKETIRVRKFEWQESSITVADSKANPSSDFDLKKIAKDKELKDKARSRMTDTVYWTSGFVWPAEGCISSPFGYRRIINGTPRRYHSGVDIAAPDGMSPIDYMGTSVYAPADGIVTLAEPDMFFEGGLVFIDHGQRLETALMHMKEVLVKEGDFVEKGDLVGRVGMSGRVTGPHLHWSLKWKDRLLDAEMTVPPRAACTPGL